MLLIYLINLLFHNPVAFIITITVIILPLFMSVAFHEYAHGYVAYKFGDMTPKLQGRLTLNPFVHLDLVGTLMLFIIGIGWAKPVMLNPLNYPNKTKQMLVALAGPASNLLLAIVFGIIYAFLQAGNFGEIDSAIKTISEPFNIIIRINLTLAIFNMIPIPPLDGSRVLAWLLPEEFESYFFLIEPYAIMLILLMLFMGGFEILFKIVNFVQINLLELFKIFMHSIIAS